MAAIMTVLVTIVMWMTALIGAIVILAGGVELLSILTGNPISIGAIKIDDHDITLQELSAGLLGAIVVVAAVIFVCLELRKILATLTAGDPFVPDNAVRLTRIAIAIAITQLLRYAIAIVVGLSSKVPKYSFPSTLSHGHRLRRSSSFPKSSVKAPAFAMKRR